VLAVPGNVFSPTSVGTNNLLKAGAIPVTDYSDVLHALGIEEQHAARAIPKGSNELEQQLLDLLGSGIRDSDILLTTSGLDVAVFNQTLTMLEITGKVRPLGGDQWTVN
jgi:DNA processing protein